MDRRLYQRIRIDAESVFILDNKDISPREFPGIVEDISESGVKIVTSKDESSHILNYLSSGKNLHFNVVDNYKLFGKETDAIISGLVTIVRKESDGDFVILGCKYSPVTKEIEKYVSDKKLSLFVNKMKEAALA